jgi:glycerol uptake facilitator-like aquaporin
VNATRQIAAEAIGTALLVATVIGSGIMAERLAGGNAALALLGNTLATGCMLVVLILVFGPVSGAHFNPAVTLVLAAIRQMNVNRVMPYIVAQLLGAVAGTLLAHAMFELPLLQVSAHLRAGPAQWLSEVVATFGLIGAILGVARSRPSAVPYAVGLYIAGAYWFTASTSFANPAVTLARSVSDTFAGIAPTSVIGFVLAELAGAALALLVFGWLLGSPKPLVEQRAQNLPARPASS